MLEEIYFVEYNIDTSAGHPTFEGDDIVRYSFEKRRVKDKEPKDIEQISELGKTIIERMVNYHCLLSNLKESEKDYKNLLLKYTPQQARQVLPNALKTEINMCGFVSDWKQFFDLRDSSHAHPDMQALAKPLHQKFINRKYI